MKINAINQKDIYGKFGLVCSNCGTRIHKAYSKAGNSYWGETPRSSIHGGTFSPAHDCSLYAENDSSLNFQARAIAAGEMIVGQTVEVVKGRKVPKGTISKVLWYGWNGFNESVKLSLPDGTEVFTNVANVEIRIQEKVGE